MESVSPTKPRLVTVDTSPSVRGVVGAEEAEVRVARGSGMISARNLPHAASIRPAAPRAVTPTCCGSQRPKIPQQQPAVAVRGLPHPPRRLSGRAPPARVQAGHGRTVLQACNSSATFQHLHVPGLVHFAQRHLVRPPVVLALLAVDLRRTGPAFGRSEGQSSRPGRPLLKNPWPGCRSGWRGCRRTPVHRRGHQLVHLLRLTPST